MLLGNGLAESLAAVRARQAALEAVRAKVRDPARAEAREAEANEAAAILSAVQAEVRRLRVAEPSISEGGTGVYGYAVLDGYPLGGADVGLIDGEEPLVNVETDARGAFALSARSERPLALRVTLGGKVIYRDTDATMTPTTVPLYRLIELGKSSEPPQGDPPGFGAHQPRPRPPREPRGTLVTELKRLGLEGHRIISLRLSESHRDTPVVVAAQPIDDGVELDVEGRLTEAGLLKVLAALFAHEPEADDVGITNASAAASLLRQGGVTSREDSQLVVEQSDRGVARRFGIKPGQAAGLKVALARAMSKIRVPE